VSVRNATDRRFVVARNPQEDSPLPYLVRLPLKHSLALKARAPWPATERVYCHRFEEPWPEDTDIVDEAAVLICRRRGPAVDLVLDRPRQSRSQLVFTQVKSRQAIFWQTQKTARPCSSSNMPTATGSRISSPDYRSATQSSRSSSPTPAATPKTGPTASSSPRSPMKQSRAEANSRFSTPSPELAVAQRRSRRS
jgi:hypothetical protein